MKNEKAMEAMKAYGETLGDQFKPRKPKHSKRDMEKAIDEAAAILREPGGREKLKAQTLLMKVCADIMAGKLAH